MKNKTKKPLKPSIKNLAVKRIGKIRKTVKMLGRVKGLDLSQMNASLDQALEQLNQLASGTTPTADHSDLI